MLSPTVRSIARPATIFPALMSVPIAAFIGTLITDIAYARTASMQWETFSIWLLTGGLIAGGIAVLVGLIDAFALHHWPSWSQRLGYAVMLILALLNAFVHSRDAYTSVVPDGLTLSVLTVVAAIVTLLLNPRRIAGDRFARVAEPA